MPEIQCVNLILHVVRYSEISHYNLDIGIALKIDVHINVNRHIADMRQTQRTRLIKTATMFTYLV